MVLLAQEGLDNMAIANTVGNSLDGQTGTGKFVGQDSSTINNANLVNPLVNGSPLSAVAITGAYVDITGRPTLATVATTGAYADLTGKPTIPAAQIQSDWTQASSSNVDFIKNKPTLATVATTGVYADLTGKPTIPAAQIQSDWTQTNNVALDFIKNKPVSTYSTPTFASTTTSTLLSATREAQVVYAYPVSITTLIAPQSITALLRYADDAGMSVNVVTVCDDVVGAAGILSLALTGKLQVSGRIPANKYRRVTFSQTGGATVPATITSSQEVLL